MGQRVPPKDDAIARRFAMAKERLSQEGTARQQRESDELKRAEAASGMRGAGAFLKQRQMARDARNQDITRAAKELEVAESGERFQQDQIQAQRDFQRAERELSQQFAAEQADIGREFAGRQSKLQRAFARDERIGSQAFQSLEAGKQRGFSRDLFDREMQFKANSQAIQESQFNKQFEQALKQFALDEEVTRFNMQMAKDQFNKKSMTEWLMGGAHGGQIISNKTGFDVGGQGSGGGGALGGMFG